MLMQKYVIGLDYGSDSVRALLVNAATGKEEATSVHHYTRWKKREYCDAGRNQFRQHPLDYLEGMEITIKRVLEKVPAEVASNVIAIAADTTGSTPVAVDHNGTPLALLPEFKDNPNAMFILWKDHTAIAEADEINAHAKNWGGEDYTKYSGGTYSSEWFWSKILHILRNDKQVREAAFSWVEHSDWIPAVLTGNTEPLTMLRSRCAAGHKAMWHASWNGLPSEKFLKGVDQLLSGLRSRLFEATETAGKSAGTLTPEWAEKLGLSTDVIISTGAIGCHFGAVGGQIEPYFISKIMGTSTCDVIVAPNSEMNDQLIHGICGQVDGSIVPGMLGMEAGQSAFGDIYAWFKRLLGWPLEYFDAADKEKILDKMLSALEKEASKIDIGQTDILALDWLNGRRTPNANQNLKGALFGLTLGSSAPMIYRALVESTVFGAAAIADCFKNEGVPVKGIIALGGVAKKSPFIMQMCADVLDMPIKVVKSEQACALGGAMFAATAAGLYKNVEDAMQAMGSGFEKVYNPIPENTAKYTDHYASYKQHTQIVENENL
ncbi:MAG: ribulokinase [Lentisphaerae bacterium]|nr:ribulokinase [Lentisphaerota bacterium]